MGRHSAGESFLKGLLAHATSPELVLWNVQGRPEAEVNELVTRLGCNRPIRWLQRFDRAGISSVGVMQMSLPDLNVEAWSRRPFGQASYAICGLTHTTATGHVQNLIADLLLAPTEEHDCLICTSEAVRASVEEQLEAVRDYLAVEYGPRKRAEPLRTTIPLGVNPNDFRRSDEARARWRKELNIGEADIVALYVGRFNVNGKMNPLLMARSLEMASARLGSSIHWVNAGWAESDDMAALYRNGARSLCPSVAYHVVDGRRPDVRFSIWSVADFFISFSDNIQETFGLTPVEAMAAGLPSVVTDWNGYRDTIRHGIDGFRISTRAAKPGLGEDLAYRFANKSLNYDSYIAATSQFVSIDYAQAVDAICALSQQQDLRSRMGADAKRRANDVFSWKVIIPSYEALWAEQNARRLAWSQSLPSPRENPWRLDPLKLFGRYPSEAVDSAYKLFAAPEVEWPAALAILRGPLASHVYISRPTDDDLRALFEQCRARPGLTVAQILEPFAGPKRMFLERALIWMARVGVLILTPDSSHASSGTQEISRNSK